MGRTEFLTETDCERALVGRAKAKASTRAKWRSSSSACRRVLEKCLTPPTLLEMGILQQLTISMAAFGLESGADDRVPFPRAAVSCLRSSVPLGSQKTSRIQIGRAH